MRRALPALLIIALLAASPIAAFAGSPASLPKIEDEVMCPICGTLLGLSASPQADRERVFIRKLIAEGRSEQEIKDALVAQYGEEVLALPEGRGFNLSAYLVPIIAFLIAAGALGLAVVRWRRQGRADAAEPAAEAPSEANAERVDRDMERYDI